MYICTSYLFCGPEIRVTKSNFLCLSLHSVQSGNTALTMAALSGCVEVAQLLLQKHADVSICNHVCGLICACCVYDHLPISECLYLSTGKL